jgi:hypothetical protein
VRIAVRKAVDAVGEGAPWPPDWDAVLLEEAEYPEASETLFLWQ